MQAAVPIITAVTVLVALAGCTGGADASLLCPTGTTYVDMRTSLGTLLIEMLPASAPNAVDWFLDLVERGHYDGLAFHETLLQGAGGYMLGGDRDVDGETRTVPVDPPAREISESAKPDRIGRVLLGAEGRFFILFGPAPQYEGDHSVFGQVVDGLDIMAGIHYNIATATGAPFHPIVIEGFTIGCDNIIPRVRANFITPLVWHVRGDTDHALVWAHNGHPTTQAAPLSIRMRDGSALPGSWDVSFAGSAFTLARSGARVETQSGILYPDWAWTLATLTVPMEEPSGVHELTLHAGAAAQPFLMVIFNNRTQVSAPGDEVRVQYAGRFADSLLEFDEGVFDTVIGSGLAVPGFDLGLAGLIVGEPAILHLPPPLAYGSDRPAGDPFERFNGRSLDFFVRVGAITQAPG